MKKIFSIFIAVLLLTVFPFKNIYAQEDTVTTSTDTATEEDSTTDGDTTATDEDTTTTDEATTTAEDTVDSTYTDTTDTTTGDTANTENADTAKSTTSFLDNIDTVWLWVILGVGGVVLVGSLIGIISLSKKEKKEEPEEQTTEAPAPVEEEKNIPQPEPQPQQEETPVVEEKKEEEEAPAEVNEIKEEEPVEVKEGTSSIQDTLGETSSYQQPEETNEKIVSNAVPSTDIDKDLADLNSAFQQTNTESEVSNIEPAEETPSVQEPSTTIPRTAPVQPETVNGLNMIDNNFQAAPEAPDQQTQEKTSMPNPQKQESGNISENTPNEGFSQPINTTSL